MVTAPMAATRRQATALIPVAPSPTAQVISVMTATHHLPNILFALFARIVTNHSTSAHISLYSIWITVCCAQLAGTIASSYFRIRSRRPRSASSRRSTPCWARRWANTSIDVFAYIRFKFWTLSTIFDMTSGITKIKSARSTPPMWRRSSISPRKRNHSCSCVKSRSLFPIAEVIVKFVSMLSPEK